MQEMQIETNSQFISCLSKKQQPKSIRRDGAKTKWRLIEAGGEVFAEKGFSCTTGKEIAKRAGVNCAAINYHFGGINGLYVEVLTKAHNRVADLSLMEKIVSEDLPAIDKLIRLIESVLKVIFTPKIQNWELKVLGRETLNPESEFYTNPSDTIKHKQQIIVEVISDILNVEPNHPAVARCFFTIVSPMESLLAGTPATFSHLKSSDYNHNQMDADDTIHHLCSFIVGGIYAISKNISIMECHAECHDVFT